MNNNKQTCQCQISHTQLALSFNSRWYSGKARNGQDHPYHIWTHLSKNGNQTNRTRKFLTTDKAQIAVLLRLCCVVLT